MQHIECSAGESLLFQDSWRRWTQKSENTTDRWVSAVDRWCRCRYQPVALSRIMPNTHRRTPPNATKLLCRVGGVNTIRNWLTTTADGFGRQFGNWPNRLYSCLTTWILIDIKLFQQWRHNDVIVEKAITIYQNSQLTILNRTVIQTYNSALLCRIV